MATVSQITKRPLWLKGDEVDKKILKKEVENHCKLIKSQSLGKEIEGSQKLHELISFSWSLDTRLARDAADYICDLVRLSNTLDTMLNICTSINGLADKSSQQRQLQLQILSAIEQLMIADNRQYIANHHLFPSFLLLASCTDDMTWIQCGTGIFENLFKVSQEISLKLINSGGLDAIMYGCRCTDSVVLHHCAAALANCALYGCDKVHKGMISKQADHWLFPLAFSQDSAVKYYALIAICLLASERQLLTLVTRSGTLELVIPFLQLQDPLEFPQTCPNHAHGRAAGWLKQLKPLLACGCEEAQSLAAFHFAMEAAIKQKQNRLKVFDEIDVIGMLVKSARDGSQLTSKFSCQALQIYGTNLPPYQCWDCLNWSPEQVALWIKDQNLSVLSPFFKDHFVSGDILMDITIHELQAIGCDSPIICRWLLQRVRELRCKADFSNEDPEHICQWLVAIGPELAQYKVDFIRSGVTREVLTMINNEVLKDIGIHSSIHRLKIVLAIDKLALLSGKDSPDFESHLRSLHPNLRKKYDVFLSYRRSSGSQLASLLKVHLQLHGLNVFLDVTGLGSGKFDEALLTTISNSLNMVIVLTHNALDRCIGDVMTQDWVHKELAHAIDSGVHIVPLLDGFQWPENEKLPADIRSIAMMNGVNWSHEYQDACVEKLINFLHLPGFRRRTSTYIRQESSVGVI
jgi:hypothetical protein